MAVMCNLLYSSVIPINFIPKIQLIYLLFAYSGFWQLSTFRGCVLREVNTLYETKEILKCSGRVVFYYVKVFWFSDIMCIDTWYPAACDLRTS
jgi:hypothetical protein